MRTPGKKSKSSSRKSPRHGATKKGGRGGKPSRGPRKKRPQVAAAPRVIVDNPRAQKLARRIAQLCLDKKALDVVILDVRGMTSYADYFVIASGESERQVSALAEGIEVQLKTELDARPIGTEGRENGNWVLLDFGEVVVHLFYAEQRAFYDLEGLWADAPRELVTDAPPAAK